VDTAAKIDTAVISVRGDDLSPELDGLANVTNTAGFSKKKKFGFARYMTAEISDTGNPLQTAYAKAGEKAPLTKIPDGKVVFRSEKTILTGAQIIRDMGNLFPTKTRFEFSQVEFTFDVSAAALATIRRQAIHRARQTCSLVDDTGRRTLYVGSRHSPWQLRVYDKAERIVRIEFVFRREFLFKNGLLHPIDLLKLRVFDLEQLVTFRRVSPERLEEAAPDRSAKWREGVIRWAERWPISKLPAYLRDQGIPPGKVLRRTQLQKKIMSMQKNFIW